MHTGTCTCGATTCLLLVWRGNIVWWRQSDVNSSIIFTGKKHKACHHGSKAQLREMLRRGVAIIGNPVSPVWDRTLSSNMTTFTPAEWAVSETTFRIWDWHRTQQNCHFSPQADLILKSLTWRVMDDAHSSINNETKTQRTNTRGQNYSHWAAVSTAFLTAPTCAALQHLETTKPWSFYVITCYPCNKTHAWRF